MSVCRWRLQNVLIPVTTERRGRSLKKDYVWQGKGRGKQVFNKFVLVYSSTTFPELMCYAANEYLHDDEVA